MMNDNENINDNTSVENDHFFIKITYTTNRVSYIYRIYIVPKDDKYLLIKYKKLILKIKRDKTQLIDIFMYILKLIENDYIHSISYNYSIGQTQNIDFFKNEHFYNFSLNVDKNKSIYNLHDNLTHDNYNTMIANIHDILPGLIYLYNKN